MRGEYGYPPPFSSIPCVESVGGSYYPGGSGGNLLQENYEFGLGLESATEDWAGHDTQAAFYPPYHHSQNLSSHMGDFEDMNSVLHGFPREGYEAMNTSALEESQMTCDVWDTSVSNNSRADLLPSSMLPIPSFHDSSFSMTPEFTTMQQVQFTNNQSYSYVINQCSGYEALRGSFSVDQPATLSADFDQGAVSSICNDNSGHQPTAAFHASPARYRPAAAGHFGEQLYGSNSSYPLLRSDRGVANMGSSTYDQPTSGVVSSEASIPEFLRRISVSTSPGSNVGSSMASSSGLPPTSYPGEPAGEPRTVRISGNFGRSSPTPIPSEVSLVQGNTRAWRFPFPDAGPAIRQKWEIPANKEINLSCAKKPVVWMQPANYPLLLCLAIYGSPCKQLKIGDIYAEMERHFEYFRANKPISSNRGWKGSMRNALTNFLIFRQSDPSVGEAKGKGCWHVDFFRWLRQQEGN